jgi:HSP20 family molecular chaperone IbpA
LIKDLDELLAELSDVIESTLRQLEEGKVVKSTKVDGDDFFKITTRVSIGPAIPETIHPPPQVLEPLVDVFDDEKGLRVVVELPGVKKEDVQVHFINGLLRIEVSRGGRLHRVEVPCKIAPGSVDVKSTKENNSVVEIKFARSVRGEGL